MLVKPSIGELIGGLHRHHPRYRRCVGHWMILECGGTTLFDASGHFNHGAITGVAWDTNAIDFNSSGDVVNAGSGLILDDLGPLTAAVWVRPDSAGDASNGAILSKNNAPGTGRWVWKMWDGGGVKQMEFQKDYSTVTDLYRSSASNTIEFGVLQHLAVTWDGSASAANVKFFKNGLEVGYDTSIDGQGTKNSDAASNFCIGNINAATSTFDGLFFDVRLYGRVLAPGEILSLYQEPFLEFEDEEHFWFVPGGIFDTSIIVPTARRIAI